MLLLPQGFSLWDFLSFLLSFLGEALLILQDLECVFYSIFLRLFLPHPLKTGFLSISH
jgi:hypothetical protein